MQSPTLTDIGLAVLLSSLVMRIFLIGMPTYRFYKIFRRNFRKGAALIREMEIEGLDQFIRQEMTLALLPYFSLCLSIWGTTIFATPMSEILLLDFSNILIILTLSMLIFWILIDWRRSYDIHVELGEICRQTELLKNTTDNIINTLQYVVHLRGSVTKTAVHLGTRAAIKLSKKKVETSEKTSGNKPLNKVFDIVDKVTSFPENMAKKAGLSAKKTIDQKLSQNFSKYAQRTRLVLIYLSLWSLVPAIWLTAISTLLG